MNRSAPGPRVVVRQVDVLWRQLDDQILMLDVSRSRYLRLNRTGTLLWRALREPRTPDELTDLLQRSYEVPQDEASADVTAFLARLREHGLVREAA